MNKTLLRLFAAFFAVALGNAWAQESKLRPCPTDTSKVWTDCYGTFTYSNGEKYVGEFNYDKRNGQGTFTWSDGRMYVGEFRHDKRDGRGTNTFPTGEKYVGEYKDDKRNGQGTFTWSDGTKYVGEFRDGNFNGQGIRYDARGKITESGLYENDKLVRSA